MWILTWSQWPHTAADVASIIRIRRPSVKLQTHIQEEEEEEIYENFVATMSNHELNVGLQYGITTTPAASPYTELGHVPLRN